MSMRSHFRAMVEAIKLKYVHMNYLGNQMDLVRMH